MLPEWRCGVHAPEPLDVGDRELALLATAAAEHCCGRDASGAADPWVLLESTHVLTAQDANRAAMVFTQRQMADAPQLETLLLYDASGHRSGKFLGKGRRFRSR